ncbi:MAG: integrase core domain-containing protein [Synergistales bacterium]
MGRTTKPLILRSDNSLVFTSKRYTNTVRSYWLTQEFITPYTQKQNGIAARFIKILKEEFILQRRFESFSLAQSVIGSWIHHYNTGRTHRALGYKSPVLSDKVRALTARVVPFSEVITQKSWSFQNLVSVLPQGTGFPVQSSKDLYLHCSLSLFLRLSTSCTK